MVKSLQSCGLFIMPNFIPLAIKLATLLTAGLWLSASSAQAAAHEDQVTSTAAAASAGAATPRTASAVPRTTTATSPTASQSLLAALTLLPEGAAKALTAGACTSCHDLGGLAAYRGYWDRAQWLAMVESMVKNGAVLDAEQVRQVTDYLNQHYGRQLNH
jgi:hypothetical protein